MEVLGIDPQRQRGRCVSGSTGNESALGSNASFWNISGRSSSRSEGRNGVGTGLCLSVGSKANNTAAGCGGVRNVETNVEEGPGIHARGGLRDEEPVTTGSSSG